MANYKELINRSNLVLINFTASWCGPCQTMAPVLAEVKKEIGDALSIIKIDVDNNRALASSFNVQVVPTFILYKNGVQVWRQSGLITKADLLRLIK